ncbi:MAG: hypothetical protein ACTHJ4_07630 [Candidatus Nucleicultricaceae bacterium]
MIKNIVCVTSLAVLLMGCESKDIKPQTFPDQSGNKKGPGLFSKNDDGFVFNLGDFVSDKPDESHECVQAKSCAPCVKNDETHKR